MNTLANLEKASVKLQAKRSPSLIYYFFVILTLGLVGGVVWLSYPHLSLGIDQWSNYLNFTWAHNSQLVENLLLFFGMFWLSISAIFWGGWFLKRLFRKIRGLQWRATKKNNPDKPTPVMSPEFKYLTYSCRYLVAVLLFFILQYPLQYIVYPF